jgi:hypothetical protein
MPSGPVPVDAPHRIRTGEGRDHLIEAVAIGDIVDPGNGPQTLTDHSRGKAELWSYDS